MTPAEQLHNEIASLQEALINANPGMPTMLRQIHTALKMDAELVGILSPEEVGVVVSGLMKQTQTVIATAAVKKSKNTKKLSQISLDDL